MNTRGQAVPHSSVAGTTLVRDPTTDLSEPVTHDTNAMIKGVSTSTKPY